MTVKKILTVILVALLVCGVIGICMGISLSSKNSKTPVPIAQKCKHKIIDGACELCGKTVAEISWTLDIVTKDCNIKFFVDDDKKCESFGAGVTGNTVSGMLDTQTVIATSALSDTTRINVYKCMYSENGEHTGYVVDSETILFDGKKYDKEYVATLKATSPLYEIVSCSDCLYIFEKAEVNE